MERGREGRRGAIHAHAPRRPRTGFKDAAVGDDGDDVMDDGHNPRSRERVKKDSSGVALSHAVATSIVGPSSRNKRKRHESQEKQIQVRSSPADEVEETTEDTEMRVSEDDDDHPPPIIPRRSGKPRPQSKFAEDGNSVDLPTVPRKARTAMGKRLHEALTPLVEESPGHQAGVASHLQAPSSTPLSSLKPGKRTKPGGSKQRNHKLPKVSAPSLVSEQEVEVAEALFDLARMFTQPPPPVAEPKAEPKVVVDVTKSDNKQEAKVSVASGCSVAAQVTNGGVVVQSALTAAPTSGANVGGIVMSSSSGAASAASPIPSPPSAAAPVTEVLAKRKRPRVRTRTEESGATQSRAGSNAISVLSNSVEAGAAQVKDVDQIMSRAPTVERSALKVESSATVTPAVCASATNVGITGISTRNMAVASCGTTATVSTEAAAQGGAVGGSVPRADKNGVEKKVVQLEKTAAPSCGEVDVVDPNPLEKRGGVGSPVRKKKDVKTESEVSGACVETVAASTPIKNVAVEAVSVKMESNKRCSPPAVVNTDADCVQKREIDLMVAPSKLEGALGREKDGEIGDGDLGVRDTVESPAVDMVVVASVGDGQRESEEVHRVEMEKTTSNSKEEREKEMIQDLERERCERERHREVGSQRELAEEMAKERDKEKERERAEASKMIVQRSSKSTKGENGRVQKAERAAFPGSAPPDASISAVVSGNMAPLPKSMGMLHWPSGMPGYFPTAAAPAADDGTPTVQLPYIMPQRASWKRCALHVYIAHFIDMQQQLNRHQTFIAASNQGYPKSYNLNVPFAPSDGVFGGAAGNIMAGAVGGALVSGSTGASANLEATERGLNAAAIAAAAAASMQGVKERAYNMDFLSRKSPEQQQHSGQQARAVSLQTGSTFAFPVTQSASPSGASGEGAPATAGLAGAANLNGAAGGVLGGASLVPGSRSPVILGPGSVGGLASAGSNGGLPSAAVQAQYMQAIMQQPQGFPFGQFPPHFGHGTFNGSASHMGAQQAAAQFFAAGAPFFTHHMILHSQQQAGQPIGSGSGAGASNLIGKQQQQQGQGGRGFPSAGSGAHGPPIQSPSHSQLQGGMHGASRVGEREGLTVGESGLSGESRLSMPRGSALYGQTVPSVSVASASPNLGTEVGGMAGHGAMDYNLMVGLGKASKSREKQVQQGGAILGQQGSGSQGGSPALQQHGLQHHGGAVGQGGGVVGGNGMEGGMSGGFGMSMAAAMNRGASVGPGPLGLASVAAVMAPQGHAMIQNVGESGSGHQQMSGSMLQQQQQQHLLQMQHVQQSQQLQQQSVQVAQAQQQQRGAQNGRGASGMGEDSFGGSDGSFSSSGGRCREREVADDRKLHGKRASGAGPTMSRDSEGGGGTQSSAIGSGGLASSRNQGGTTLNLMAPTNAGMASRPSQQSGPSGVAATMQHQAAMGASKNSGARSKGTAGSNPAVSAALHSPTQVSFTDRLAVIGESVGEKAVPSQASNLGGQSIPTSQGGRPAQAGQHSQMKTGQSSRPTALSGATPAPTASGANFQAVLAAAMAKNTQGQPAQRALPVATAGNANTNVNAGSSPRMRTAMMGSPASSGAISPGSIGPPSKSSGLNLAKSSPSQKSGFPVSQKVGAGVGKRDSSPSSVGPVPSILGPSHFAQNVSNKGSQQPQVQIQVQGQGQGQGPQQLVGSQSQGAAQTQGPPPQMQQQQQQMMRQQQHQMLQQQMFQHQQHHQQQHLQQPQPVSHVQGSQGVPQHLQVSQQQPSSGSQVQQVSSQQQILQLQHASLHSQQQFAVPAGNGNLALSSGLTLGAGSNISAGGGGRSSMNSDKGGGPSNGRLVQAAKQAGGGGISTMNSGVQRGSGGPGGAPGFLEQYGSSVVVSLGQQQLGSPRNSTPSGYTHGNPNSGAVGRADGGHEHVNGMRLSQGVVQARAASTIAPSTGTQGSSQRPQSSGGGASKSGAGQLNSCEDVGQSRTNVMTLSLNSAPQSGGVTLNGQRNNSNSNVQNGVDGRPAFNSGPLQQSPGCQIQVLATSSLSTTGGAVSASAPVPVLGTQLPGAAVICEWCKIFLQRWQCKVLQRESVVQVVTDEVVHENITKFLRPFGAGLLDSAWEHPVDMESLAIGIAVTTSMGLWSALHSWNCAGPWCG
uniref:Uncharacterized protein n=1 Tax=Physcomitrium patens TaxID=3218 RepID=A0A7I4A8S5_PHYPA